MMDIEGVLFQWFINFLIRSCQVGLLKLVMSNEELAKELHEEIIRKFDKRKLYSSVKDNIWGDDLADMQLINNFFFKLNS